MSFTDFKVIEFQGNANAKQSNKHVKKAPASKEDRVLAYEVRSFSSRVAFKPF